MEKRANSKDLQMALTLVQNKVCNACGADVRPNSLFCYNCGKSIVEKTSEENLIKAETSEEKVFEEKETANSELIDNQAVAAVDTEAPEKTIIQEQAKLKSAAGLRRKPKSVQNRTIEVVWEEHENAPNVWFLSVAIFIMILVGTILFLAMYLK